MKIRKNENGFEIFISKNEDKFIYQWLNSNPPDALKQMFYRYQIYEDLLNLLKTLLNFQAQNTKQTQKLQVFAEKPKLSLNEAEQKLKQLF